MKILLKIQYIGTAYCGFQCQKNAVAVQNVLTDAAKRVFGVPCLVTGSSRTDAGVHALGFCATVETGEGAFSIPVERLHRAFSQVLPDDISVIDAALVCDDFHPRYSAKGKNYIYRIWDSPVSNPFERGRSMFYPRRIDGERLALMEKAAAAFVGKQDFSAFMATGSKVTDTVRTVSEAFLYREEGGCLVFSVSADGFLYNMVRIMAGTLIEVASGKIDAQSIKDIISSKNRKNAGVTAPPEGLYLKEVFYDENICWQGL